MWVGPPAIADPGLYTYVHTTEEQAARPLILDSTIRTKIPRPEKSALHRFSRIYCHVILKNGPEARGGGASSFEREVQTSIIELSSCSEASGNISKQCIE